MLQTLRITLGFIPLAVALAEPSQAASYDGVLTINVVDELTTKPLAARMELRNSHGKPVRLHPKDTIVLDDYFVFDGSITLKVKQGTYQFFIEAGPEFQTWQGHFTIERHAEDSKDVVLTRRVNMQNEGWWAADLDVSQKLESMPLLMRSGSRLRPGDTCLEHARQVFGNEIARRRSHIESLAPFVWALGGVGLPPRKRNNPDRRAETLQCV